jgi:hypothetical protein
VPVAPPAAAGLTNVTLALPPSLIKAWLAAEKGPRLGQGNAGLLLRWGGSLDSSHPACLILATVPWHWP